MQVVLIYLKMFRRNSLLKCVPQAKSPPKNNKTPNLVFKVIQDHCFRCQLKAPVHFLLVINSNVGFFAHRV